MKFNICGDSDSRFVDKHRRNTKSDLIEITEDKLENILLKHLSKLEMQKRWLLPFSILLSVSLTLASANFRMHLISKQMSGIQFS